MSRGYGQGGQYQPGGWAPPGGGYGGPPGSGYGGPPQNGYGGSGGYNGYSAPNNWGNSGQQQSWGSSGQQQSWGSSPPPGGGWGGNANTAVRVNVQLPGGQMPGSQMPGSQMPGGSMQLPPSYGQQAPQQGRGNTCTTPFGNNDMTQPPLPPPGSSMPPPPPVGARLNGPPSMSQWQSSGQGYSGYGAESQQLALPSTPQSLPPSSSAPATGPQKKNINVHIDFGQSSSSTAPTNQRLSNSTSSAEWRALMDSARAMVDAPIKPKPVPQLSAPPVVVAAHTPSLVTPAPPALHHDATRTDKKKKTLQFGQRTSFELGQDRPSGGHKTDLIMSAAGGDSPTDVVVTTEPMKSAIGAKRCSVITAPTPAQLAQHRSSVQSVSSEYWEDDTIDEDQIKAAQKLANKLALRRGQGVVKKG